MLVQSSQSSSALQPLSQVPQTRTTQFRTIFAACLLVSQSAYAALTPTQIKRSIETVTEISSNAALALGDLSFRTDVSVVRKIAPQLVQDFELIINSLASTVSVLPGTQPLSGNAAATIVATLKAFVQIHQQLLAVVIGKDAPFAQFGLTAPIAAVLRTLESGVDAFALALINLIPTEKNEGLRLKASLDASVSDTRQIYNQVCIPSLFYPKRLPSCA